MTYVACLHCSKPFTEPGVRRYCSQLCKSAEFKRLRELRALEDAYWGTITSQPAFELTDVECYAIEARVSSQEQHVYDGNGFRVKDAHKEEGSANAHELHDSWNDKGAELDVWRMRIIDRLRFGGIMLSEGWWKIYLEDTEQTSIAIAATRCDHQTNGVDPYPGCYQCKLRAGAARNCGGPRPIWHGDPLENPMFHEKLFVVDLDELYEHYMNESEEDYDLDTLNMD